MRGESLLGFAALSLGCSAPTVSVAPAASDVPRPEQAATHASPEPAPVETASEAAAPELGEGLAVTIECAPEFCDNAAWMYVEFRNHHGAPSVLEVPGDASNRDWTTAEVRGEWEDDSGFGLGGALGYCHAAHGGACWAGTPLRMAEGAAESFGIRVDTARPLQLAMDVEIPWQQSPTLSAEDAQPMRKAWRIQAQPTGPREEGCVPMTCTISPAAVKEPVR